MAIIRLPQDKRKKETNKERKKSLQSIIIIIIIIPRRLQPARGQYVCYVSRYIGFFYVFLYVYIVGGAILEYTHFIQAQDLTDFP